MTFINLRMKSLPPLSLSHTHTKYKAQNDQTPSSLISGYFPAHIPLSTSPASLSHARLFLAQAMCTPKLTCLLALTPAKNSILPTHCLTDSCSSSGVGLTIIFQRKLSIRLSLPAGRAKMQIHANRQSDSEPLP